MKYKIPKNKKGGSLLKENNSSDPIYEGGMIPAAVLSYKYTMKDYDNLASKKNLNQVPSVLQSGVMEARVRGAINKGVKDVLLPTIGVAAAPIISIPIISSAIASPSAFIGGIFGGVSGQVATDKIVQKASKNKYSGWGDMVSKKTSINPIVSEFTNPGSLIGGALGSIGIKPMSNLLKNNLSNIKIGKYEILPSPNKDAHYRNIGGKKGYIDVVTKQSVDPPKLNNRNPLRNPISNQIQIPPKQFNRAFYERKGIFSPALRYKGPYAVEAKIPMVNGWGGNYGYAPNPKVTGFKNVPLSNESVRLLKQYRLPNTERVLIQKELSKEFSVKNPNNKLSSLIQSFKNMQKK